MFTVLRLLWEWRNWNPSVGCHSPKDYVIHITRSAMYAMQRDKTRKFGRIVLMCRSIWNTYSSQKASAIASNISRSGRNASNGFAQRRSSTIFSEFLWMLNFILIYWNFYLFFKWFSLRNQLINNNNNKYFFRLMFIYNVYFLFDSLVLSVPLHNSPKMGCNQKLMFSITSLGFNADWV